MGSSGRVPTGDTVSAEPSNQALDAMGVTIQAESHRVELAALYEYEHDAQVLEYYDQPPPIKLVYEAKHGRHLGVWHTADYFVVRTDAIGWEEWKTEAGLESLAETMPNRLWRGL